MEMSSALSEGFVLVFVSMARHYKGSALVFINAAFPHLLRELLSRSEEFNYCSQ